jgi:sugar phosphate isomerase/epimerase
MDRRAFVTSALAAPLAAQASTSQPRLGVDLFSLRSQGWSPFQHLDYCAKFGAKVVHFSEIRFLGSLEDAHVRKVGEHAARLGIELEIGMRSVCPTSSAFDAKAGTAEEQLNRVIGAAKIAQSKIVRAFLGTGNDRKPSPATAGKEPIEAHIENTVKVLRNVRSRAQDAGIRIAIENHAGDMQARELKMLIEEAGRDFVGACFDSGNPLWALEDPHITLETLHPYILTSHIRDSYLWNTPDGTAVNWTRMGEGNVNIEGLLRRFVELCPGKTMSLEIIVMGPRPYAWRKPGFWEGYRNVRAAEFARFLALAEKGQPQPERPKLAKEQAVEQERADFESSMAWTSKFFSM